MVSASAESSTNYVHDPGSSHRRGWLWGSLTFLLLLGVAAAVIFGDSRIRDRMFRSTPAASTVKAPEQQFASKVSSEISAISSAESTGSLTSSTLQNAGDQTCNDVSNLTNYSGGGNYGYQWMIEYWGTGGDYAVSGIPPLSAASARQTFVGLAIEYICPQYRNQIP